MSDPTCTLHTTHTPVARTVELHHVIPQAWQRVWVPGDAKPDRNGLWDPRTVPICPTGHRNTHYWIVNLMRRVNGEVIPRVVGNEVATAQLALDRFRAAGGRLIDLIAASEWGQV